MPFELRIWNATKSNAPTVITQANSAPISGGFAWERATTGDGIKMTFTARNDVLNVRPRAVVQYLANGVAQFYGIVTDPPSLTSKEAEEFTVLGAREAMNAVEMDGTVYDNVGGLTVLRDVLTRLMPPALTYDVTRIGDGTGTDAGRLIVRYHAPYRPLGWVVDDLCKTIGAYWWVDPEGVVRVVMNDAAPATLAVPFDGQPWRRLRVEGRETVTKANVLVLTAPNLEGQPTSIYAGAGVPLRYLPATAVATAEHAEHATYGVTRTFPAPAGVDLFLPLVPVLPVDGISNTGMTNLSNAIDGDLTTYAEGDPNSDWDFTAQLTPADAPAVDTILGFQLTYTLTMPATTTNRVRYDFLTDAPMFEGMYRQFTAVARTLPLADQPKVLTVLMPPDVRIAEWLRTSLFISTTTIADPAVQFRVYDLRFLTVDKEAAEDVAATFLHLPYSRPAEVVLAGLYPPAPVITVTGSPDGDVTGPTAAFEYRHETGERLTTRVKIGATGESKLARAIQWTVRHGL